MHQLPWRSPQLRQGRRHTSAAACFVVWFAGCSYDSTKPDTVDAPSETTATLHHAYTAAEVDSASSAEELVDVTAFDVIDDGSEHSESLVGLIEANPSATLYFPCGTYLLNHFAIANTIRLKGASRSCVTLRQADDNQTSFITATGNGIGLTDIAVAAAPDTVNGINYTGTSDYALNRITVGGAKTNGVKMSAASNVRVKDSRFAGNGHDQFIYNLALGATANGIHIENSEFDATGVAAPFVSLYIGTSPGSPGSLSDIFITNNRIIARNRGASECDGLVLANGGGADGMSNIVITGNTILNDTASGSASYGIELASTTNNVVSGNIIVNFQKGILLEYAAGAPFPQSPVGTVSGNIIRPNANAPNGGSGIYVLQGNWTLAGNMVTAPGYNNGYGIALFGKHNVVTGNSVYSTTGVGINIAADDTVVSNNIILGPAAGAAQGIKLSSDPRKNVEIRNNHISNVRYGIYALSTTFTKVIVAGNSFSGVGHQFWGNTSSPELFISDDSSAKTLSLSGNLQLKAVPVSGLGVCTAATEGTRWGVIDANAPSYGEALVGGGTVHLGAYCNGTSWIAH